MLRNPERVSVTQGLAICVTQTEMEDTPAIPAFSPFMKSYLSVLSRAATNSLCPPAKENVGV